MLNLQTWLSLAHKVGSEMDGHPVSVDTNFGAHEEAMQKYLKEGEKSAHSLGNRGRIRFNADGTLCSEILEAYSEYGFYIFEGVLDARELADIEKDFLDIKDRLPTGRGAKLDAKGRPALGSNSKIDPLYWAKPLGDPFGGTEIGNGRHQVKMTEPESAPGSPEEIVYLIHGSLQYSDACLRVYGHPELLGVAEQINGEDFVPFSEVLFIKEPGLGASVSWHQDGQTHWNSPLWNEGIHGFNFMAQLYGCTAANGLWVVPRSHKLGKVDINTMRSEGQADRIPGAVPLICDPGDVAINSRQLVHGSFANTSADCRVTVNFGFHRRSSVINVNGKSFHNEKIAYDEQLVHKRSRVIGYAIDARRQRFPEETPFVYKPFIGFEHEYEWNKRTKADLKDYDIDLFI